ncbi:MAG: hypothetical protein JWN94_2242 [Betaproteobacteria bacterium]|nr:hypothetical protein [Betaproteobacteria bacterium]
MGTYTLALCAIMLSAEIVGLGGKPAGAMTAESLGFVVLLLASIALALKGYARR